MTKLGKLTFAAAAAIAAFAFSAVVADVSAMPDAGNIGKGVSAATVPAVARAPKRQVTAAERRRARAIANRETAKLARAIKIRTMANQETEKLARGINRVGTARSKRGHHRHIR